MSSLEAVLLSDIHISHKAPIARSEETDWYAAMERPWKQIKRIANGAPIVCAGDVFHDGWRPHNCPPELINWAIDVLPHMYAVMGQHDCKYHRREDYNKSAFYTLVCTGTITQLVGVGYKLSGNTDTIATGASWGQKLSRPPKTKGKDQLFLAVLHRYIWIKGANFPDAPQESRADCYAEELEGYDCSLWGDNHTTFSYTLPNGHKIFNPGSLMRRNADQIDHRPCVGKLFSEGRIEMEFLDCSEDKIIRKEEKIKQQIHDNEVGKEFLDELFGLAEAGIDFPDVVKNWLKKTPNLKERTRDLLIQLTEK